MSTQSWRPARHLQTQPYGIVCPAALVACSAPARRLAFLTLLAAGIACQDNPAPTGPPTDARASLAASQTQDGTALEAFPELIGDIPELRVDRELLPPELSDADLVAAVREKGGMVNIGFKPANASRAAETGVFPAISRHAALAARDEIRSRGVRIVRSFRSMAAVVAEIEPELAPVLRRLSFVDYVEPQGTLGLAQATPPQDTSWGARQIQMPFVWFNHPSNLGQFVNLTIIDTGSDYLHRTSASGDGPANSFFDCYYVSPWFTHCNDDMGHGTHVAGIASAWDNAYGYIGVARQPNTTATVKVCSQSWGCVPEALVAALDWTATNNRHRQVVNMSLADCTGGKLLSQAVAASAAAGNLLIAAAGNTSEIACGPGVLYPAKYSEVVAVSGTLQGDVFAASFACPTGGTAGSRYGPQVELSAPYWAWSMELNGQYGIRCGTSFAAPLVTGVAALVWRKNPAWTAAQVRNKLRSTAIDLGVLGPDSYFGYGRVDAAHALADVPPSYWATIHGRAEIPPYTECLYTVDTSVPNPTSYVWEVNDVVQPGNSPAIYISHGGPSFMLRVNVSNGQGGAAMAERHIIVSGAAPPCLDT